MNTYDRKVISKLNGMLWDRHNKKEKLVYFNITRENVECEPEIKP